MRPIPLNTPQSREYAIRMIREAPEGKEVIIQSPSKTREQEEMP